MRMAIGWREADRRLSIRLAPGSRLRPPARREIEVRLAGATASRTVVFDGRPVEVTLDLPPRR
jgi:hypothetical protein